MSVDAASLLSFTEITPLQSISTYELLNRKCNRTSQRIIIEDESNNINNNNDDDIDCTYRAMCYCGTVELRLKGSPRYFQLSPFFFSANREKSETIVQHRTIPTYTYTIPIIELSYFLHFQP